MSLPIEIAEQFDMELQEFETEQIITQYADLGLLFVWGVTYHVWKTKSRIEVLRGTG